MTRSRLFVRLLPMTATNPSTYDGILTRSRARQLNVRGSTSLPASLNEGGLPMNTAVLAALTSQHTERTLTKSYIAMKWQQLQERILKCVVCAASWLMTLLLIFRKELVFPTALLFLTVTIITLAFDSYFHQNGQHHITDLIISLRNSPSWQTAVLGWNPWSWLNYVSCFVKAVSGQTSSISELSVDFADL